MPTYTYKNLKTEEIFEVQQRITEAPLTVHPETGDPIKRLVSRPGIAFKGSGFYVNDSRPARSESSSAD
ncbi:putative FmdB family regulatory protein [Deinobacterium chartae]|uniref:Putative FmdB family regulatory protein n=1 Tax=Deinobacterium chartae TaxID=521158 RepID=A0A841HUN3_9DEIO|nr:FmdB family zinc ribbon protein [Deinobacterium chartae]MBB6096626.1 putative FmdB family regulatory protein [Deinobacterium chartae]